ncbi:helix-turn-helix domain-containing protein [Sphingobium sp.]|uniref:helix-turn-helix domain-containing protein n=1 Tax=Sphingobium sp. TaxID=1912891 RepID=UPI00262286CC|nr:helix-turn-helix domain-containing protein [Sphingobium sp.]
MSAAPTGFALIRAAYDVDGLDEHERGALVLLAVMANDQGEAWPSIAHMVEKTGQSERTLQRAIGRLVEAGHISRRQRRHESALYNVHPKSGSVSKPVRVTGVTVSGVSLTGVTDAVKTRQPDTLIAKNNQSKNKGQARGSRLAPNWIPGPLPGNVASLVTQWPAGREDREFDQFRDFWTAKAGADACKLDWDRTWHTWIRRAHDRIMREASYGQSPAGRGGATRRANRSDEMDAAMRDLGFR